MFFVAVEAWRKCDKLMVCVLWECKCEGEKWLPRSSTSWRRNFGDYWYFQNDVANPFANCWYFAHVRFHVERLLQLSLLGWRGAKSRRKLGDHDEEASVRQRSRFSDRLPDGLKMAMSLPTESILQYW